MSIDYRRAAVVVRRTLLVVGLAFTLAACSAIIRKHGYVPVEEDIAKIQVGVDDRDTVLEAIGAPVTSGLLESSDYYYVASRFRHYGPLKPEEIDREVLVIVFGASGRVSNIERYSLEDGNVVTLSRRVTTSATADKTFLRQLMGNIGNVDAGQFLGRN